MSQETAISSTKYINSDDGIEGLSRGAHSVIESLAIQERMQQQMSRMRSPRSGRMQVTILYLISLILLLALVFQIPSATHAYRSTRQFEKGVLMGYILALKNQQ